MAHGSQGRGGYDLQGGEARAPSAKDSAIIGRQGMPWSWWTASEVVDCFEKRLQHRPLEQEGDKDHHEN
jgi:hypothetical protein